MRLSLFAILLSTTALASDPIVPDPKLTPGSVYKSATKEVICKPGYARKARNVSIDEKRQVFSRYHVKYVRGSFEVDHFEPICLGGDNSLQNLWPEPISAALKKDDLERSLCRDVCAGRMELKEAQERIRRWKP